MGMPSPYSLKLSKSKSCRVIILILFCNWLRPCLVSVLASEVWLQSFSLLETSKVLWQRMMPLLMAYCTNILNLPNEQSFNGLLALNLIYWTQPYLPPPIWELWSKNQSINKMNCFHSREFSFSLLRSQQDHSAGVKLSEVQQRIQLSQLLNGLTRRRGILPMGSTSSRSFQYSLEERYFMMQFHSFECTLMSNDSFRRERMSFQVGAIRSSWIDRITQYKHSMLIVSKSRETYYTSVSPIFLQKALKTPSQKFLQCSFLTMRVPLFAKSRQQFSMALLLSPFMQVKGWKQRIGDFLFLFRSEFSVDVEMLMERWFRVSLGYLALMLLLLLRLLFWMLMLDMEMEAMLCTGFWTTSPSRWRVVFIDLVYFIISYSLQDRWDSMKIISFRKGYRTLELSQKSSPNSFSELKLRTTTGSLVLISPTSLGFSSMSRKVSFSGTISAKSMSSAPQLMQPQQPSTSSQAMYSFFIFIVSCEV